MKMVNLLYARLAQNAARDVICMIAKFKVENALTTTISILIVQLNIQSVTQNLAIVSFNCDFGCNDIYLVFCSNISCLMQHKYQHVNFQVLKMVFAKIVKQRMKTVKTP